MNSIDKLADYVKKATNFSDEPEGSVMPGANVIEGGLPTPSTSSPTPTMTGAPGPAGWGGTKIISVPTQFRLYLDGDFIPGTTVKPTDVKIQPEQGSRGGTFIDKRLLQTHQKELYENSHSQSKTPAYGGIIVNKQGQILIREAAGKFGFEGMPHSWTLSKGKLDKGEKPEDAALREVLEETGIKASITSEVPGHFTSKNSSTKFFMMTVDKDTGKFGKAETSAVKWVDAQEAIDIFKQNIQKDKDGKVLKDSNGHAILHDSSQRDVEAIAMAMHHHSEVKGDAPKSREEMQAFIKNLGGQTNFNALTNDLISHYIENDELPPEFRDTHGKYSIFLKTLGTHTRHPLPISGHSKGSQLGYNILPALYKALDTKYNLSFENSFTNFHKNLSSAWKNKGIQTTATEPHVLQEIISEFSNTPANFMYGKAIPEDVSKSGRPIFRSDEQRHEIIEKFASWSGIIDQLDDNQTDKMKLLKELLDELLFAHEVTDEYVPTPWQLNSRIKSAKAANVPSYMIKDAIRDQIAEKYKLTKIGDINKKIKDLKIKGVPTAKTPAHAKEGSTEGSISQVSAKGEYSWKDPVTGEKEKYDFEDGSMATINVREGGKLIEKEVPSWELMNRRAKKVLQVREAKLPPKHKSLINKLGKALYASKFGASAKPTSSEIDRSGREFISEYARHTRTMSKMALDAAWPEDDFIYVGRKTSAPREITGDEGMDANTNISEDDLVSLGMAPKASSYKGDGESIKNPLRIRVHSTSIAGGSFNPSAYSGPLWISTKIHKDDILQVHSLSELHGGGERESIFINNPDRESSVIWTQDGEHDNANWVAPPDGLAGLIPEGIHDRPEKVDVFNNNVFTPHINYKNELEPATFADDPIVKTFSKHKAMQLGSNKGGLYKMKSGADKGKLYYIKHDNPAQAANEGLSNALYEIANIKVPKTKVVKFGGGNALMSEWLPDHKSHSSFKGTGQAPEAFQNHPDLQSGFLVDALLANYDVVGMNFDNIVESGGNVYRLDQGGSLNLRAQGMPKESFYDWNGPYIPELTSMMSPDKSPKASQIYKNMDDKTWKKAAQNLLTLTNSNIQETVEKSTIPPQQMDGMTKTLQKRRDSVIKWLVEENPTALQEDANDLVDINSINKKYNILKMEILKATDPELDKLKNAPSLWISGNRGDDSDELTEDFDLSEQIKELQRANLDDVNTLTKEEYE